MVGGGQIPEKGHCLLRYRESIRESASLCQADAKVGERCSQVRVIAFRVGFSEFPEKRYGFF
jgi:hypothetical protein